jgi:secreted trypsin-like serine protease
MKKAFFKSSIFTLFLALGITSAISPAKAITYGSLVNDPAVEAPYVVSIWNSPTNDMKDAEFLCTGSLIAPDIVLTAAHCTLDVGSYFVKVQSESLNDGTPFTTVSGVWTSPRYNAQTFVNDIGMLKIDTSVAGVAFPTLANAQYAKAINKFSVFTLYGWGKDQSGNLADLLRSAKLNLQDAEATKDYKGLFNSTTMISASKKITAENVWSGSCYGDSGGPLTLQINGTTVLAGVTSWGEKSCTTGKPSVFARVSYYNSDILKGMKDVELQATVVNRTPPVLITDPTITGSALPGSTITCNTGSWKNAVKTEIAWTSPARLVGSTAGGVVVRPGDAGQNFSCQIIVSSKNALI